VSAGAAPSDFTTEQMLRNGESLSIASGGEALAQPQSSELPVFTAEGQSLGRFHVDDLGDSLALRPVSGGYADAPAAQQRVRVRATARVKLDADDTAWSCWKTAPCASPRRQTPPGSVRMPWSPTG
jgi:hypothetical protein